VATFDLLKTPWLTCVRLDDGTARQYSLYDLLADAHGIREVAEPSPLVTLAAMALPIARQQLEGGSR